MCPPNRVEGVTARSKLTTALIFRFPKVERFKVSGETSAEKELCVMLSAVKQTPLTEIESPSFESSVTIGAPADQFSSR